MKTLKTGKFFVSNLMKIRPAVLESFHTSGRTDGTNLMGVPKDCESVKEKERKKERKKE
jgi:hypothetical protein